MFAYAGTNNKNYFRRAERRNVNALKASRRKRTGIVGDLYKRSLVNTGNTIGAAAKQRKLRTGTQVGMGFRRQRGHGWGALVGQVSKAVMKKAIEQAPNILAAAAAKGAEHLAGRVGRQPKRRRRRRRRRRRNV